MDPTLVGVIIGSVLSFLGTSINQLLNISRDGKQWEREQEAEERKLVREEEKQRRIEKQEAKARLREIYQESIQALSTIVANQKEALALTPVEKTELFADANRWLSLLSLHRQAFYSSAHDTFHRDFDHFVTEPDFYASYLRNTVIDLAMTDLDLFPDAIQKAEAPDMKFFQMTVADDFRKEQLLAGVEVQRTQSFQCSLASIKPSQREKLWNAYFPSPGRIPERVVLYTPVFDDASKNFNLSVEHWRGSINPNVSSPEEVIDAWEADYEEAIGTIHE